MTLKEFLLISNIQIGFYIFGTILSFIQFGKKETHVQLIGIYCLASALADLSSHLLFSLKINPNYAGSIFYILTSPVLSLVYFLVTGRNHKRVFGTITMLYFLFGVINFLLFQKDSLNTYSMILLSIITICYCLYYFYWLLKELPTTQLHRLPMFWINSAFIVYFSGNLFFFVFASYLVNVLNNDLLVYFSLHNVLGIIEFSLIIFALWIDLQNIKLRAL